MYTHWCSIPSEHSLPSPQRSRSPKFVLVARPTNWIKAWSRTPHWAIIHTPAGIAILLKHKHNGRARGFALRRETLAPRNGAQIFWRLFSNVRNDSNVTISRNIFALFDFFESVANKRFRAAMHFILYKNADCKRSGPTFRWPVLLHKSWRDTTKIKQGVPPMTTKISEPFIKPDRCEHLNPLCRTPWSSVVCANHGGHSQVHQGGHVWFHN